MVTRGMKGLWIAMLALSLVTSGLVGCEYFKKQPPKKEPPKVEEAKPKEEIKGTPIAKVNDQVITLEELNEEITNYNTLYPEDKVTTTEDKLKFLKDRLIRQRLLYQEAKERGLERKETVIKAIDNFKVGILVAELVREESNKVQVSSKEVEDYYNQFKDAFKDPEERRISEIAVKNETQAKDVMIELLKGGDFSALARQYSVAASAAQGGDLGYIKREGKFPQYLEIAFSLGKGDTSNIFSSPDGLFYILKAVDIKGGKQKSLSDVWDDIKNGLTFLKQNDQVEALIGRLTRDAKIETFDSKVK